MAANSMPVAVAGSGWLVATRGPAHGWGCRRGGQGWRGNWSGAIRGWVHYLGRFVGIKQGVVLTGTRDGVSYTGLRGPNDADCQHTYGQVPQRTHAGVAYQGRIGAGDK